MELVDLSDLPDGIYPDGVPAIGAYLTDGATLFRLERLLADGSRGKVMMELEDCASLDVVLCPARPLVALGLRLVIPEPIEVEEPPMHSGVCTNPAFGSKARTEDGWTAPRRPRAPHPLAGRPGRNRGLTTDA